MRVEYEIGGRRIAVDWSVVPSHNVIGYVDGWVRGYRGDVAPRQWSVPQSYWIGYWAGSAMREYNRTNPDSPQTPFWLLS